MDKETKDRLAKLTNCRMQAAIEALQKEEGYAVLLLGQKIDSNKPIVINFDKHDDDKLIEILEAYIDVVKTRGGRRVEIKFKVDG